MLAKKDQQTHNLVPGRAGELTLHANKPTFELLEKIFGYHGPYRNVLKKFGVKVNDIPESYLVLQDETVYTDVQKEQFILWGNYPYRAEINRNQVNYVLEINLFKPHQLINLLAKSIKEAIVIANVSVELTKSHNLYKEISDDVQRVFDDRKLSTESFLVIYGKMIYVTYLYELLDLYNKEKISTPALQQYVRKNDYLVNMQPDLVENYLRLDNGFYLDHYHNLESKRTNLPTTSFIPDMIGRIEQTAGIAPTLLAEKELQCLKNNLRLKTNILLYFLNLSMLQDGLI